MLQDHVTATENVGNYIRNRHADNTHKETNEIERRQSIAGAIRVLRMSELSHGTRPYEDW